MLLDVKNLDISYGSKLTVSGVNIQLDKGEILSNCRRIGQRQNNRYPCCYGLPARQRACFGRQHNF